MQWLIHHGDLLEVPADVLICSANVYLNLSGGVGGAFQLRYGVEMQTNLHHYLAERGLRHVERGDVIAMPSCGSPYHAVLHAVAVDGFYESSPAAIYEVLQKSLQLASEFQARTVALTAVATGYGRLTMADFAAGVMDSLRQEFPPIERIVIGLRSKYDVEELLELMPGAVRYEPT